MTRLQDHLRAALQRHKLLVPYVMAGIPEPAVYPDAATTVAKHADMLEIGLPFSDPLMDGPVIAAAGEQAIRAGIGPLDALEATPDVGPRAAMTYYNPIHRIGERRFCARAARSGFSGLIVPDLPLEESGGLRVAAAEHDLAWIPLVAPTSSTARVEALAETSSGFVYAVSTLGVTGARQTLSERAAPVVARCREATDLPVLVGVGVGDASVAKEAATFADGVVVGTAVVERLLAGRIDEVDAFLEGIRAALGGVGEQVPNPPGDDHR